MFMTRGAVKARTGMRTQDPRLAQHCDLGSAFTELAAKGRRKARLLSARDALQSDPSSQKRGRTMAPSGGRLGAAAPSSQSRRHERKHLHPYNNDVLDVVQLQVSQVEAQSLLRLPPAPSRGMRPYNDHQTAHIDYTGEKLVSPASGLPANLNKIKIIMKNLLANTRKILGSGRSVALCVRAQPATTTTLYPRGQLCSGERSSSTSVRLQPAQDPEGRARSFRHRYGREEEPRGREGAPGRLRQLRHHHSEGGRVSEVRSLG